MSGTNHSGMVASFKNKHNVIPNIHPGVAICLAEEAARAKPACPDLPQAANVASA
jgi:hypothetical protein